ncbi:MAG: hypothetical protein QM805_11310 [Pseudomonas sp.]
MPTPDQAEGGVYGVVRQQRHRLEHHADVFGANLTQFGRAQFCQIPSPAPGRRWA